MGRIPSGTRAKPTDQGQNFGLAKYRVSIQISQEVPQDRGVIQGGVVETEGQPAGSGCRQMDGVFMIFAHSGER